jgi:hypothetical protein
LRNKDLEVKSLFFFHLGTFRRGFGLPPGVGPPFHPDQKVKLDKSEATRGGFPWMQSARHDKRYATSGIAAHFSKSEKWGTPIFFTAKILRTDAVYEPVLDVGHPPDWFYLELVS